jgi:isoaspartyl peptidase/L-asparaginase-like protein (Ntn-hydrolase superfamily)
VIWSLAIHGGAGTKPEAIDEVAVTASLTLILEQGRALLEAGGSALDAKRS